LVPRKNECNPSRVEIVGLDEIPLIKEKDDLGRIINEAAEKQGTPIKDYDVIVIAQKIVSKAEGRVIALKDVEPSEFALKISKKSRKPAQLIELILRESRSILKMVDGHIITQTNQGWIFANAGIDRSNVSGGDYVSLLPEDADVSALRIRKGIESLTGKSIAVIVSDTSGRPFRDGHTDLAIGSSGIFPLVDRRGEKDIFGYTMRVKKTAIIDVLSSAAELVIGQVSEKTPVAIIRGFKYNRSDDAKATMLLRPREKELFI
jgi:coenzyme F420-0:L-glutamate ligase/coenzyme F420-1:gamma-L-glutamate ligase